MHLVSRAWVAALVATAVLSSLVWGPLMLLPALAFGAAALAIAAVVPWALRTATRSS